MRARTYLILISAPILAFGALFDEDTSRTTSNARPAQTLVEPNKANTVAPAPTAPLVEPDKAARLTGGGQSVTMVVTGSRVNVRSGPSTQNAVLTSLPKGTPVQVRGRQGNWAQIAMAGQASAWMSGRYLAPPSAAQPRSNPAQPKSDPAPIRTSVSTTSPVRITPKRTVAVPTEREISEARRILISRSHDAYPGPCPCPYNRDRAGRRCGKRSAWSKPGGYAPLCYDSDITQAHLQTHFARKRGAVN